MVRNPKGIGNRMQSSLRCGAKTRNGTPCMAPAVTGKKRCRMHGGAEGSGAPRGNQNALKHGRYDTLCRRAELVQLQIDDLAIKPNGSGTILVKKSKADQFGDGRLAYLSAEAVTHLERWLNAANLKTGPIFRHVHSGHIWRPALHASKVASIVKNRAEKAGIEKVHVAQLSGHSMRVGAAQDMAAAGIDLGAIMHAGGWKSPEMVIRYIEHLDVQKSGMARLYGVGVKES